MKKKKLTLSKIKLSSLNDDELSSIEGAGTSVTMVYCPASCGVCSNGLCTGNACYPGTGNCPTNGCSVACTEQFYC